MDPANGHHSVLNLALEESHLIYHEALVHEAFLPRQDQGIHQEVARVLKAGKDAAGLHILLCVRLGFENESIDNFDGQVHLLQQIHIQARIFRWRVLIGL